MIERRMFGSVRLLVTIAMIATFMLTASQGGAASFGQPAKPGTLSTEQWQSWRDRFVTLDGRVIDTANKSISHSEGQGYGLLLSVLALDRATFTRIWTFTHNEMLLRDDGLAVWRWDPDSKPHVTDVNNAADGDILIAYALALGGNLWEVSSWTETSRNMAEAIGQRLVRRVGAHTVLMPGVKGFGPQDRPDGPVLNLSYWIFEALPVLARLAPNTDWKALAASGEGLIRDARFGSAELPADWISLKSAKPALATGFEPRFSYDAVRIPLYLLRAGNNDQALLKPFAKAWGNGTAAPPIFDLAGDKQIGAMDDPGYRMIGAVLQCALDHKPVPTELRSPKLEVYYPATLYLLALSAVAQHYPECL
ncbi:glycosyl hydrolase family 8 [Labrys okinawensis]|nr:glycosyl hydrolase family 8 [Labrys okinawensis]